VAYCRSCDVEAFSRITKTLIACRHAECAQPAERGLLIADSHALTLHEICQYARGLISDTSKGIQSRAGAAQSMLAAATAPTRCEAPLSGTFFEQLSLSCTPGAMAREMPRSLVGPVVKRRNSLVDARPGRRANVRLAVDHARYSFYRHAGKIGNVVDGSVWHA